METHTFTEEYRSPVNTNFNQEINSSNQQLKPNENPYHQFANTVGKPPQSNSKIIPTSQIMTNSNKLKINLNQDKTLTKPNPTEEMGPAKSSNYGNINKAIISNSESRPRSPPNSTKPPNGGRSSTPTINGNGTVIISTNENFQRYPVILNRHDDYVGNPRTMNAKQSKTISQTKQMPNISYTKTNTFPQTNSKKVKKPQNENNRLLLQKLNAQINGIYDQRKAEEIIELFDNFICKPNDTNSYNRICLVLRNRKSIPFQIIVQMKDLVLNYFK